jgi:hypothetical protein
MIKQPDIKSKTLAIIISLILALTIGLAAYLPSALNGDVNSSIFTISQSLAYGVKSAIVTMVVIFMFLLLYLIYYRGHNKFLYIRLFLIIAICILIITIVWITTIYNKKDHYILAFFIFIMFIVYIFLSSIVIYQGLKIKTKTTKIILYLIPIFALLGIIGLSISFINVVKSNVKELFPSAENYMIFIQILSILSLGFI